MECCTEPLWKTLIGPVCGFLGVIVGSCLDQFLKWLKRPRLDLLCNDGPLCVLKTRITPSMKDVTFLRLRVTNAGRSVAQGCRGYLTAVERENTDKTFDQITYTDSLALKWSYRDHNPIELPQGVDIYLDLFAMIDGGSEFLPLVAGIPNASAGEFKVGPAYRATVWVTGESARPEKKVVTFDTADGFKVHPN